jgi:spore maturation protein SpmA
MSLTGWVKWSPIQTYISFTELSYYMIKLISEVQVWLGLSKVKSQSDIQKIMKNIIKTIHIQIRLISEVQVWLGLSKVKSQSDIQKIMKNIIKTIHIQIRLISEVQVWLGLSKVKSQSDIQEIIKNMVKNNSYSICVKGFFTCIVYGSKILVYNIKTQVPWEWPNKELNIAI